MLEYLTQCLAGINSGCSVKITPFLFYDQDLWSLISRQRKTELIYYITRRIYVFTTENIIKCEQFKKNNKFIYLFLAALDLRCCARASSSCGRRGLLFIVVHGLIAVASLVAEHGL